jgi:hypothetical protein
LISKYINYLQVTLSINEANLGGNLSTCPLHVNGRLLSDDNTTNSTRLKAYVPVVPIIYSE